MARSARLFHDSYASDVPVHHQIQVECNRDTEQIDSVRYGKALISLLGKRRLLLESFRAAGWTSVPTDK